MYRSPSPYGSPYTAPAEPHYSPNPYSAATQSPGGGPAITPGSITYTTSTGPDGQIIYHPFKAVPASYQTPTGVVTGIQWVPAEATHILPNGAQPASVDFAEAWSRGNLSKEDQRNLRDWQRSEEKRRKKEEKESIKILREKERDRYSPMRYENDPDLRLARERDAAVVTAHQRRKSFSQSVPPSSVTFPPGGVPSYAGSERDRAAGFNAPGPYTAPNSGPGMGYPRERKYSTGGSLAEQFADLGLEHESNLPPGSLSRPRKYSTHEAAAERARRMSGNFGTERPPSTGGFPKPPFPGTAYSNPSPRLRSAEPPYMAAPRPSSPYGPPPAYGGSTTPYGARAASPYQRGSSPYHRSTSPFAGEVYPPGHIMEGRPVVGPGPTARSRGSTPIPGGMPAGAYPSVQGSVPGTLAAPDCFSRPLNAAHPYTPFEPMKIDDMDFLLEGLPPMPVVLQTHDVYGEDWRRFMDDVVLAWSGRLPVPTSPINGKVPKRATLAAKLIELWNHSFFERRGVELVLYKGRERRSGPQYGILDMPYYDDDDDTSSSSSSSSDSDDDPRLTGFYGGHGTQHPLDAADSRARRHAARADKKRRKREKKQRRKEREKRYSLFLFCLPQGGPGGVGSIYGTPASAAAGAYGRHSPALTASALRGASAAAAVAGTAYSAPGTSIYPGMTSTIPTAAYGTHSPARRGPSPGPPITSSYPGMMPTI
ncbi:hypothetical protein GYMLUDRAFT_39049 [Collybiopsis luxurians FD-317 M1]|nr:hypothetical protein GYMLUDRAFT_39049 [Collybiopsis luxurians FD-317 M1]